SLQEPLPQDAPLLRHRRHGMGHHRPLSLRQGRGEVWLHALGGGQGGVVEVCAKGDCCGEDGEGAGV
ncbi:hypothetical protein E4U28_007574, partial [Claviceps purpurea]